MARIIDSISIQQARKLVLFSQRVPPPKQTGAALELTLSAIEHLGYIQIDTISAIQRAHHHTLWNRNPQYLSTHLDKLMARKKIFEYWSHAAAYLPMRDFRYSLLRKQAIANGDENHWYERDKQLMKLVLKRIADEGPLMVKDFLHNGEKSGEWESKPAKRILENLFMQGEIMVPYRLNFHKVYDLTERVLPEDTDISLPNSQEYARFLITRYLQANGLGQAGEIVYLLKNTKRLISTTLEEMTLNGELLEISVRGNNYHVLPSSLELLTKSLAKSKLKILSPFDNLLIQRRRTRTLFDFDYQLECYVPENKRKFGYFALPVLWHGKFVARMDCKTDRKKSVLHIHALTLEPGLKKSDALALALSRELISFLKFNGCSRLKINRSSPSEFKMELEKTMKNLP